MFCRSCGKEMTDNAVFCPSCGAPSRGAVPANASATPWQPTQHVSGASYLVPPFFGIIVGIIAWSVTKGRDPKRATNLLIFGLVWTLVPVIVVAAAIFFLTAPFIAPRPYP